jgi:hypothetical protein
MSQTALRRRVLPLEGVILREPPIFQALLLFLFFLPLLSVQIPGIVAGFSINLARLFITLALLLLVVRKLVHPGYPVLTLGPGRRGNRTLDVLLGFLFLSVIYYYVMLGLGESVLFGAYDSFFRSWRGRPLGQLVALLTYAILPYWLIVSYGRDRRRWMMMGRALVASTLLLLVYGLFQQVSFVAGLPVSGRLLYEGAGADLRPATYSVGGISLLRFYSLGGEPRDYGTFAMGATLLYVAWTYGRRLSWLVLLLLVISILLTISASTIVALAVFVPVLLADAVHKGWIRPSVLLRSATALGVLLIALLLTPAGELLVERPLRYWEAIQSFLAYQHEVSAVILAQSSDIAGIFYLAELPRLPPHQLLFGSGFGNYSTGMHAILFRVFQVDLVAHGSYEDSRSFLIKMLVEVGVVGVLLFGILFVRTLRAGMRVVLAAPTREERTRMIALRYSYMAFFFAAMAHVSFYHFLIMGLIDAGVHNRATPEILPERDS